jgi:mediator of RNA polymerase II transcription subunit 18
LFGDFFAKDVNQILNRFTQISESATQIHVHEIVLEPISERDPASEPVLLRCRKDTLSTYNWLALLWTTKRSFDILYSHRELYSHLKPEPARVHPEATVRSAVYCSVSGNALTFASALGYRS